jgi:starch synthase
MAEDGYPAPQEPVGGDACPSVGKQLFDRASSYSCLSHFLEVAEDSIIGKRPSYSNFRHSADAYDAQNLDVPVVVVASEVEPWSKSGGLAIVAGAYGYEFAVRGHRTMVVVPMYDDYPGTTWCADKDIHYFGQTQRIKYFHSRKVHDEASGVATDYIFVNHDCFRRAGGLYHDHNGEYGDNLFRFGLFALAALEAPLCCTVNGSVYGDKCIFLANDWQAGLVPVYLAHKYRRHGTYNQSRCIFVVHNMGYQGAYPWDDGAKFDSLGLHEQARNDLFFVYPEHMRTWELDKGECLNLTKGGIITSDRVITVSKNYASEITTPEGGFLLNEVARGKAPYLQGIQNGIEDTWDPKTDRNIKTIYDSEDMSGKKACKQALQESLGLEVNEGVAIIGFVGRLTWQKGLDIIQHGGVVDWLLHDEGNGVTGKVQLIFMGNGEAGFSDWLKETEHRYKGRICGYAGFDPKVERSMMAGCDFLLMPSRYEPCGIPQMVALTYGTVPIVHATGGLKDSVKNVRNQDPAVQEVANGYYLEPLTSDNMKEVLYAALETFQKRPEEHKRLMKNGMNCNFYWCNAVEEYERNFDWTMNDAPLYGI